MKLSGTFSQRRHLRSIRRITRRKSTRGSEVYRTASRSKKQLSWTSKADGNTYRSRWLLLTSSGPSTGRVGCLTSQVFWNHSRHGPPEQLRPNPVKEVEAARLRSQQGMGKSRSSITVSAITITLELGITPAIAQDPVLGGSMPWTYGSLLFFKLQSILTRM